MLRFLLVVGILSAAYFMCVGFLRTAEKAGWSEADAVSASSEAPKPAPAKVNRTPAKK